MKPAVLAVLGVMALAGCRPAQEPSAGGGAAAPLRVGHEASPVLGPLYAALEARPGRGAGWAGMRFATGGEVGYALLAGELDAGFLEARQALRLLDSPGGTGLRVAGAIQFPYGATLVVRADHRVRLSDLKGFTVAALEPGCKLLHQFRTDARRLGVDPDQIRFTYMPAADMLPALEARAVDAALVRGALAVLAETKGHKVLYQNWEVKPGDGCCPEALAQVEQLLVVRKGAAGRLGPLLAALSAASDRPPAELRGAVARATGFPEPLLGGFPQGSFAPVGAELRRELGAKALEPGT